MGRVANEDVGMGESDEDAQHFNAYSSGDDDDSSFDEAIPLNEIGRLRMRSDIDLEGPDYVGKRSSRSAAFEGADEETVAVREIAVDDDDDEDDDDDDGDLRLLGNIDNELEREYEELRKQEEELVNKLKRKRTDDQGKGDSVRNQRALWDRALELRISMQKLVTGSSQLPEMEGKLELCTSDSQCEKAYHPLTKSAVAALDCLLELKNALLEQNTAITEACAANVDGECGLILLVTNECIHYEVFQFR
ncbi:hypothetical protein KC19_1G257200 [Ceratodon purpureus]|uniref:AATF leucine zipper-containing domain-containing protein n=1 Tax=Ceratodon purpureus TaxID=3225 RepID=A0A8T0JC65_CERPU|nr:hypothetical protein KC19_1G257200 [Ceratodon purpureus]